MICDLSIFRIYTTYIKTSKEKIIQAAPDTANFMVEKKVVKETDLPKVNVIEILAVTELCLAGALSAIVAQLILAIPFVSLVPSGPL